MLGNVKYVTDEKGKRQEVILSSNGNVQNPGKNFTKEISS